MRKCWRVLAVVGLLAAGCQRTGRYELIPVDGRLCRIDTQTGEVVCSAFGRGTPDLTVIEAAPGQ